MKRGVYGVMYLHSSSRAYVCDVYCVSRAPYTSPAHEQWELWVVSAVSLKVGILQVGSHVIVQKFSRGCAG